MTRQLLRIIRYITITRWLKLLFNVFLVQVIVKIIKRVSTSIV